MSDAPRRPLLLLAFIALLGVADGLYLTLVHLDYEVGRAGMATVCHLISDTGCTVTAGRYGDVMGVPVATIGMAGALGIVVLALAAWRRRERWDDPLRSGALVFSCIAVLASVLMAVFSTIEGAWCPFCVLWYGINVAQLVVAWRCRDQHLRWRDVLDDALGLPAVVMAVVFGVAVASTVTWVGARRTALEAERDAAIIPAIVAELRAGGQHTVDVIDAPRKGGHAAEVVIVEFGDFECPHCRKLFQSIETFAASSSRAVAVVFAHFPLDSSCNRNVDRKHPHACGAAIAGECARRQGKFWELATVLFEHQRELERERLREYAGEVGLDVAAFDACMVDPSATRKVEADIALAMRLGIEGTPTFFINGHRWTGAMPPQVLSGVIDGLLAPAP